MDFVTIVFNNETEINLLKLQAVSFNFVEVEIINNILVLFNDNAELNDNFKNQFTEIINYYPEKIRNKVKLLFLKDIKLDFPYSDWFTQQVVKILISKKITTKYYLILDAKNHFIKNIAKSTFFDNKNNPYIYFNDSGSIFDEYYHNCLTYFDVSCPNKNLNLGTLKIQTTTPFIFITKYCLDLITCVENKEQKKFNDFFIESKKYTEFYFYYSYLIYCNKFKKYNHNTSYHPVVTIGPQDPKTCSFNTWDDKKYYLNNENICTFSLHRHSVYILDFQYKKSLINFYMNIYKDEQLLKTILPFLYN